MRIILAVVISVWLIACQSEIADSASGSDEAVKTGRATTRTTDRFVGEGATRVPQTSSGVQDTQAAAQAVRVSGKPPESGCGADKLGRWLNVLPTDPVKTEIAATVGDRPIRYYTQGDPITMDFSPARLNVELGKDGRIKRFRCG